MRAIVISALLVLSPNLAFAADWMKAATDMGKKLSESSAATSVPSADFSDGLTSGLAGALGVSDAQASGGLGSLFSLAESTLDSGAFSQLSSSVPGMDSLLKAAPEVAGVGGLSAYSEALSGASDVYSQFKALGLQPTAIPQYIDVTNQYLQSQGGQTAVDLFAKGIQSLL